MPDQQTTEQVTGNPWDGITDIEQMYRREAELRRQRDECLRRRRELEAEIDALKDKLALLQPGQVERRTQWRAPSADRKSDTCQHECCYDYSEFAFPGATEKRIVHTGPWVPVTEESNEGEGNG